MNKFLKTLNTVEYYSVTEMDENSTISKDMDRPKYCHTEWSKSKRKNKYTCHLCVESRKMANMNLFAKQK